MKRVIHHVKRHYHEKYKSKYPDWAHVIIAIDGTLVATILALLSVGAYFAFVFHPLRDDFKFEVVATEEFVAGKEAEVTLKLSNVGEKRLHNARISAHLPKHFKITRYPENYDPEANITPFGHVAPGQSVELKMKGIILGPPSETAVFVHMHASDDAGNPDERVFTVKIGWQKSLIGLEYALPDKIVANQRMTFTLAVKNGSVLELEHVIVTPVLPESFKLSAASPPLAKNGEIIIGKMAPGETLTVDFIGRQTGTSQEFPVSAKMFLLEGGERVLLAETDGTRPSIDTNLSLEPSFGGTPEAYYLPGAEIPVRVSYENKGIFALKDVKIVLPLNASVAEDEEISWTAVEMPELKELIPGAKGEVIGAVKIKKDFSRYTVNPEIVLSPIAAVKVETPELITATVAGGSVKAKISGSLAVNYRINYFTSEGDQLGRGPWPAKVGRETRFWISVSVTTGPTETNGMSADFSLPAGLKWTGKSAVDMGESLVAADGGKRLSWDIGDMPAHSGLSEPEATASFEVAYTPTASDIGKKPLGIGLEAVGQDPWTAHTLIGQAAGQIIEVRP
jgi:hypothetical protein